MKRFDDSIFLTAQGLAGVLGRAIPDDELAAYLGMDVRTLRKYGDRWGGVETAPGRFVFFENQIKEVIKNAKPVHEKRQASMARFRDGQRDQISPVVRRRIKGQRKSSGSMGGDRKGKASGLAASLSGDRHGLDD